MTLIELYNLINFIIKDKSKGSTLTPNKFDDMFNRRQLDYFQEQYSLFEGTTAITDTLKIFKTIITQGDVSVVASSYFALPSNYAHFSTISYIDADGRYYPFDMATKSEVIMRKSSITTIPSTTYPICYEFNNNLYIEPYDNSLDFNFSYLRYPTDVVLDYYIDVNGAIIYLDAAATIEFVNGETDSVGNLTTTSDLTWFLPSLDELALMYTNLKAEGVGSFQDDNYWSSSEHSATQTKKVDFTDGTESFQLKSEDAFVRPVRSFTDVSRSLSLRDTGEGGGIIFYIDGDTYYEAAASDQAEDVWSNVTASEIGTTGTAVGTGYANTTAIIDQATHTASAALTCNNYSVNITYTSLTVEPEWGEEEKINILEYILRDVGVSLNEEGVYQYASISKNES